MRDRVEAALDRRVRPTLAAHGGGVQVLELCRGVVRFRLLGPCSGCPAAQTTAEQLVASSLLEEVPELRGAVLVQEVAPDLLDQARRLLSRGEGGRRPEPGEEGRGTSDGNV